MRIAIAVFLLATACWAQQEQQHFDLSLPVRVEALSEGEKGEIAKARKEAHDANARLQAAEEKIKANHRRKSGPYEMCGNDEVMGDYYIGQESGSFLCVTSGLYRAQPMQRGFGLTLTQPMQLDTGANRY